MEERRPSRELVPFQPHNMFWFLRSSHLTAGATKRRSFPVYKCCGGSIRRLYSSSQNEPTRIAAGAEFVAIKPPLLGLGETSVSARGTFTALQDGKSVMLMREYDRVE